MVTLSSMSIQIIDGFIAPLGIDVPCNYSILGVDFPLVLKFIQNNKHVMYLNIIYTTYFGLGLPNFLIPYSYGFLIPKCIWGVSFLNTFLEYFMVWLP